MSRHTSGPGIRKPRSTRRKRVAPDRKERRRSASPFAGRRGTSIGIRQVMALVREAEAEERASADFMRGYAARQRLEQRLSALAERIAGKARPDRDDLIALALAGWYASAARHALVRTVLRAAGINPRAPDRSVRPPRGRSPGLDLT